MKQFPVVELTKLTVNPEGINPINIKRLSTDSLFFIMLDAANMDFLIKNVFHPSELTDQ